MAAKKAVKPRSTTDLGTPELIRKRAEAVRGGDVTLAEHPLGILHARRLLDTDKIRSQRLYYAGLEFGMTWGRVFKPPFAQSILACFMPGMAPNFGSDEGEAERRLRQSRDAVGPRQLYDALVNCIVYRRVNVRKLPLLVLALTRLAEMRG